MDDIQQPNPDVSDELWLSSKAERTGPQMISYLIAAAVGNPRLINLAAGLVDQSVLPVRECRRIASRLLSHQSRAREALQYDTTIGLRRLRENVLAHLGRMEGMPPGEMGLTADNVVITNGSQQSLYLVAEALLDPGDIIITTNPCYFVFTSALASLGARVITVGIDKYGMDVEEVSRVLQRLDSQNLLDRVKLIYVNSFYQNPTGLTLGAHRRERLLGIARRFSRSHRILILEDAAYRELRYDGDALRSIKSHDPGNRFTILSQTFSKPFAPGLKVGYTFLPPDLQEAVLGIKAGHDFGTSNLAQNIAAEVLADGGYDLHVQTIRDHYRRKRDLMLHALERFMPEHELIQWTRPAGGLYVWLTLPPDIPTSRGSPLFEQCLSHGVLYVPGEFCFQPDDRANVPSHHLRLSFGQVETRLIETGIQRLANAVSEVMGRPTVKAPRPGGRKPSRTRRSARS